MRHTCPSGLLLIVLSVGSGCLVEVPLGGKACNDDHPCFDDEVCLNAVCVPAAAIVDAGMPAEDAGGADAGAADAGAADAGAADAGAVDAGIGGDAGPASDGGPELDAGPGFDGGGTDAGGGPRMWRVGAVANGCPLTTSGVCDFDLSGGPDAIQRAVDAASPGDTVRVFAQSIGEYEGEIVIDKSLTLEGDPDGDVHEIVLSVSEEDATGTGLIRLHADNVRVRHLSLWGEDEVQHAVSVSRYVDVDGGLVETGRSSGHVLEQLWAVADGTAPQGSNSTAEAFDLAGDVVVRNNYVVGWWEGFARFQDVEPGQASAVLVHNTVNLVESSSAVYATDNLHLVMQNNILAFMNDGAGAGVSNASALASAVVSGNVLVGHADVVDTGGATTTNQLVASVGFVHQRTPELTANSVALGYAATVSAAGDQDLYGQPRGSPPQNAGALEITGTQGAIPMTLHVGMAASGCGGPCDFIGANGLTTALSRAHPGSTIILHDAAGQPARYEARSFVIDRPLTLTAAAGLEQSSVTLANTGSTTDYRGVLQLMQGDDIGVSGFTIEAFSSAYHAIWVDPGYLFQAGQAGGATRARVDRMILRAITGSGVNEAVSLGHDSQLRNSLVVGRWEALASTRAERSQVVGNTFVSTQTSTAAVWMLGDSKDFIAANNLVDLSSASTAAPALLYDLDDDDASFADPVNPTFAGNQYFGLTGLALGSDRDWLFPLASTTDCVPGNLAPPSYRCAEASPGFENADGGDYTLAVGSGAIDVGEATWVEMGETDLVGGARVQGGGVDVGAYESAP